MLQVQINNKTAKMHLIQWHDEHRHKLHEHHLGAAELYRDNIDIRNRNARTMLTLKQSLTLSRWGNVMQCGSLAIRFKQEQAACFRRHSFWSSIMAKLNLRCWKYVTLSTTTTMFGTLSMHWQMLCRLGRSVDPNHIDNASRHAHEHKIAMSLIWRRISCPMLESQHGTPIKGHHHQTCSVWQMIWLLCNIASCWVAMTPGRGCQVQARQITTHRNKYAKNDITPHNKHMWCQDITGPSLTITPQITSSFKWCQDIHK